jgi:mannose-6-phosphate isomerase-like protein (cupin superfamily)
MKDMERYTMNMDIKYDHLQVIDVAEVVDACTVTWFNQTLCKVNTSLLRLGVFTEGAFHWHKHDNEDEVFFVLEGSISLDTEKGTFELKPHQGICVPKGTLHRPVVKEKTVVLMIEEDTVTPVGD